ncbi:hypothetical protein HDU67_006293 [Dinochytrium kinnereticum]|nr:hypothetical protein HDU67_006293 [Dinochytrium kinnereticum]
MQQPPRGTPGNASERKLYVGNLDPKVTEALLYQIFSLGATTDIIQSVKILHQQDNRNFGQPSLNYGFVEFRDHNHAEQALQSLNGKKIFSSEIRVNWAFGGNAAGKEDFTTHFHIFVGDLSPEVNDQVLAKAFSVFGSMSDARVMWDQNTGKSRGYGFVAFREKSDAEQAINTMNSEWLGSRPIRVNWANQKTQGTAANARMEQGRPASAQRQGEPQRYDAVFGQTPSYNTTIYVGNITPTTSQNDLIPLFSQYGYIAEIRMQADKGYAFIKLDTHENASNAIVSLNGFTVQGRQIRCSWGKDRAPDNVPFAMQGFGYQQPAVPWFYPGGPTPPTSGAANPTNAVYDPYNGAITQQQQYWNPSQQGYY